MIGGWVAQYGGEEREEELYPLTAGHEHNELVAIFKLRTYVNEHTLK